MPPRRWFIDDYSTFSHVFDEDLLRETGSEAMFEFVARTLKGIQDHPLDASHVTVGKTRFHVVRAGGYVDKTREEPELVPELLFIYIADPNVNGADAEAIRIDAMVARAAGRPVIEEDVGIIHPVCVCRTVPGLGAAEQDSEIQRLVERQLRNLDSWKWH
jgi:hypothetical protein